MDINAAAVDTATELPPFHFNAFKQTAILPPQVPASTPTRRPRHRCVQVFEMWDGAHMRAGPEAEAR